MILIVEFFAFFKVGLFSVGGGLATLPFLQEMANTYGWVTPKEIIDMIAISESTPGPIGVNMATYTGFKTAGVLGGIVATIGLVAPSIIIIIIIAHFFTKFNEKPLVKAGFYGLRPAVTGLIAAAGFQVAKITLINIEKYEHTKRVLELFNYKSIALFGILLFLTYKYKKHPIFYIIGGAIIGIIFKY